MADPLVSGLDVSHYNGSIDWASVANAGIVFAYAKATEGTASQDTHFQANYTAMQQNNILRGAYHFFRPSLDGQAQADNFLKFVTALEQGDLPPALDVEVSDGQAPHVIISRVQQWLDTVEAALGRTPLIYTARGFWSANLAGSPAFGRYPLWVAHYTNNPSPNLPPGFLNYTFWQYSEAGHISGITGSVDLDKFNGSIDDLRQLADF
jgi:lysozyme